jgi:hypothetical protein
MKISKVLFVVFMLMQIGLIAQVDKVNTGFGIGYQLVQYQSDFGFGVNINSPYFANEHIGLRLKTNLMYNQNVVDGQSQWMTYSNVSLGMIGVAAVINNSIRLYGEGGVLVVFPSSKFSNESFVMGGYGLFGFEFFFSRSGNYFIELGGIGAGTTADKIETKPIYSNGFSISTGFRFSFK